MQDHLCGGDIQRFLDRDLSQDEKKQIVNHLYACSQCRQELEDYKSIYQLLGTEEQYELSSNFTQNVVYQLRPDQPPRNREKWADIVFALAGIIVSLIGSIYYLGSQGFQPYLESFRQLTQKINLMPQNIDSPYLDILIHPYLIAFIGILAMILFLDRVVLQKRMLHFM
jgi:hypothetical protein